MRIEVTTVVAIRFSEDIHSTYKGIGRYITGISQIEENLIHVSMPQGCERTPSLITHKHRSDNLREAFKLTEQAVDSNGLDTLEFHFEGTIDEDVVDLLVKRSKQAIELLHKNFKIVSVDVAETTTTTINKSVVINH